MTIYHVLVDYSNGYWNVRGLNDFEWGNPHGRTFHMRDLRRMQGVIAHELNAKHDDEDWTCHVLYTRAAFGQPGRLGQKRVETFHGIGAEHRLTPNLRWAIKVLREGLENGHEWGVQSTNGTCLFDGQPWVNWKTAQALERRGIVVTRGEGEEAEVRLV